MKITVKQILTAAAVAVGAVALIRFVKHEAKEMKEEEEETASFTADEATYMNYVDEGFMGFTATDEFMMLGGGKEIEFADFKGNQIPIATDEPNFAYGDGTSSEVMTTSATPIIPPTMGQGGSKQTGASGQGGSKGRLIRPNMPRPKKQPLDIEDVWKSGKKYRNPQVSQAPRGKRKVGKAVYAQTDEMSSKGRK